MTAQNIAPYLYGAAVALLSGLQEGVPADGAPEQLICTGGVQQAAGVGLLQEGPEVCLTAVAELIWEDKSEKRNLIFNACVMFGSVGPVYYTLKTRPMDPNIPQGLKNIFLKDIFLLPEYRVYDLFLLMVWSRWSSAEFERWPDHNSFWKNARTHFCQRLR